MTHKHKVGSQWSSLANRICDSSNDTDSHRTCDAQSHTWFSRCWVNLQRVHSTHTIESEQERNKIRWNCCCCCFCCLLLTWASELRLYQMIITQSNKIDCLSFGSWCNGLRRNLLAETSFARRCLVSNFEMRTTNTIVSCKIWFGFVSARGLLILQHSGSFNDQRWLAIRIAAHFHNQQTMSWHSIIMTLMLMKLLSLGVFE